MPMIDHAKTATRLNSGGPLHGKTHDGEACLEHAFGDVVLFDDGTDGVAFRLGGEVAFLDVGGDAHLAALLQRAGGEQFGDPVDESTHLGRQVAVVQIDHGNRHWYRLPLRQDFDQAAVFEVRLNHVQRRLHQAKTLQRAGDVGVAVVDGQLAGHLHLDGFAIHHEVPVDGATGAAGEIMHRLVALQIVDGVRHALPLEIDGRTAGHCLEGADATRHHARILQIADANHAVDGFLHHVDGAVAHAHDQFDVGVFGIEVAQIGQQQQATNRGRHVDAQTTLRTARDIAERGLGLIDLGQDTHATLVIGGAVRRQTDAARSAIEQTHLQQTFQSLHDRGHRGARQIEIVGGARKAVGVDHGRKDLHCLKSVHLILPGNGNSTPITVCDCFATTINVLFLLPICHLLPPSPGFFRLWRANSKIVKNRDSIGSTLFFIKLIRLFYAHCSNTANSVVEFDAFIRSHAVAHNPLQLSESGFNGRHHIMAVHTPSGSSNAGDNDNNENHGSSASTVSDFTVPGPLGRIPVRLYQPLSVAGASKKAALLPLVLYFHGGGFVAGGLDDADLQARYIAQHSHAVVLSVAYALAPAKPFPAAPEDAYAAACWAVKNAAELHIDPSRMAVAGDDAGGNLAASLTMIARDRCALPFAAQVLISPMLDPSMTLLGDARRLNSDTTAETCAAAYRQYLPQTMQRLHPYAAPLEASRLAGLPPAYIATAGCDVLHTEAEKYASSLIRAGVHTQVARFAGITHGALRTHIPLLKEIVEFLRRRFSVSGTGPTNLAFQPS